MDKVRTCLLCKRLFNSPYDRELCPDCDKIMDERFDRVRRYLKRNSQCGVEEVSEATGITKRQILQWVREERLYFAKDSGVGVPCMQCGMTIQTGKYCDNCKAKMHKDLNSAYIKPKEEDNVAVKKNEGSKMRFLSKDKR